LETSPEGSAGPCRRAAECGSPETPDPPPQPLELVPRGRQSPPTPADGPHSTPLPSTVNPEWAPLCPKQPGSPGGSTRGAGVEGFGAGTVIGAIADLDFSGQIASPDHCRRAARDPDANGVGESGGSRGVAPAGAAARTERQQRGASRQRSCHRGPTAPLSQGSASALVTGVRQRSCPQRSGSALATGVDSRAVRALVARPQPG